MHILIKINRITSWLLLFFFCHHRYYSDIWLQADERRLPPHMDKEITIERNKCIKRLFDDIQEHEKVVKVCQVCLKGGPFNDVDSIRSRGSMDLHSWWVIYETFAPKLQRIAFEMFMQSASSSLCERNLGTYSFIHNIRRNKMLPQHAENLVYIYSNLLFLSRKTPHY